MPLTAAEKQKRYGEKRNADPAKRAEFLQKERESWHKRKKLVNSLSEREKRRTRKIWRNSKANARNKRNEEQVMVDLTPASTPVEPRPTPPPLLSPPTQPSRQYIRGRQIRYQSKQATLKEIAKLKHNLAMQRRLTERFKKRWQRKTKKNKLPDTPRTRTRNLLRHASAKMVRRSLEFHNVIVDSIKQRYLETKQERQRQLFARLLTGSLVRQYKMQKHAHEAFGFSARRWRYRHCSMETIFIRKKSTSLGVRLKEGVVRLFTRDDVSRVTAGVKSTCTLRKEKQQKRLLNDSLRNLHAKYQAEFPNHTLSLALSCRLRPFYVVIPKESDRQTCMCKICENLALVVDKLKALKCLRMDVVNVDKLLNAVACDETSETRMHGGCPKCEESHGHIPLKAGIDLNEATSWQAWKTIKENREIAKETKQVTITKKTTSEGTVGDLIDECSSLLKRYKKHAFNIRHQFAFCRKLQQNLKENECIIHIDFAENYIAKMESEIQSAHFGASKVQITLHTGVYYVGGAENKATSFCSISDSLQHNPASIWAHLEHTLDDIQNKHQQIDTVHFMSDGPTTQYRQKGNFFLFLDMLSKRNMKLGRYLLCIMAILLCYQPTITRHMGARFFSGGGE